MLNAQVITTISVADKDEHRPLGLAIDTINRIYALVSTGEDTPGYVKVIDGTTNTPGKSIPVEKDPRLAAVDTSLGRLYVANRNSGTLSVIDTATQTVAATLTVGQALFGVAVDPVLHHVYVASAGTGAIVVIDDAPENPQRPQVIAHVPLGDAARPIDSPDPNAGAYPYYVAVNPKNHRVYVANFGGGHGHAVSVIDGLNNKLLATISLAEATGKQNPAPHGIAVNPSTNRVYVSCLNGPIAVIDDSLDQPQPAVMPTIKVPGPCFAVRADPGTNMVWASCATQWAVLIDGETHETAEPIKVPSYPHDMAIDPGSHRAYIAHPEDGVVSVLELGEKQV